MTIDFRDIADIEGSASLILSMSDIAPTAPVIPGAAPSETPAKTAREWVREVTGHIGGMSAGDALRAAGCLDLMHRLAFGKPADADLLDNLRLAAFESFVRGDATVDRYILFNVVSSQVRQRNRRFFGNPLRWESICVDRWHSQFRHGASIEEIPGADTVRRVTALLSSDLWAFETKNESRFKQTLFENHRHYLDSIHNAQCIMHNEKSMHYEFTESIMNYELTKVLPSLLISGASFLTQEEFTTYDTRIRSALIASKETNRYHREALRLSAL